jgi:plastocyanin
MLSSRAVKPTFLLATLLFAHAAHGASIAIEVKDAKGTALEDAVVWAMPKPGPAPRVRRDAAIAQANKQFVPLVSVVQVGTQVHFPNRDEIRHHIYSFSTPKPFEIKLYAGTAAAPVLFDKPGEVVLGCNIHDHMIAYLYVLDTPWFATTGKDGRARLEGLPAGDYEVHARHYAQAAAVDAIPARLKADEAAGAEFTVATKVVLTAPAPPPR